jgi:hypothetical protein
LREFGIAGQDRKFGFHGEGGDAIKKSQILMKTKLVFRGEARYFHVRRRSFPKMYRSAGKLQALVSLCIACGSIAFR